MEVHIAAPRLAMDSGAERELKRKRVTRACDSCRVLKAKVRNIVLLHRSLVLDERNEHADSRAMIV